MPSAARILVVDDSATARHFTAKVLERAGYVVQTAADIWIAPVVTQFRPDLILMDVHVGSQKGPVAIAALKRRAIGRGIRMALYSSMPSDALRKLADEVGADAVVPKCEDPQELLQTVSRILQAPLREANEIPGTLGTR